MSNPSLKQSNSFGKGRVRKFRAVFYQRFEQMVELEAESEVAASDAAHLLLERGEINPAMDWCKSEIDLDGVYEICDDSEQ